MKLSVGKTYWSFAAASAASTALAAWSYLSATSHAAPLQDIAVNPFIAMGALVATLGYGLVCVMPAITQAAVRKAKSEQLSLAVRAAELEVAAMTDSLTGLHNRRYFEQTFDDYFAAATAAGSPLALLVMDVDEFKAINDSFGHDVGDLVLQKLANCLRTISRDTDIVARLGGDEICIVANFAEQQHIIPFAERVCETVANIEVELGHMKLRPTVSVGVASLSDRPADTKAMMKLADKRMYSAKRNGRRRVIA